MKHAKVFIKTIPESILIKKIFSISSIDEFAT